VAFFRDALGLPEEAAFSGDGDERVVILQAGRATLELANPAHHHFVDRVEVGRPVAPRFRIAFEVADVTARTAEAVEAVARAPCTAKTGLCSAGRGHERRSAPTGAASSTCPRMTARYRNHSLGGVSHASWPGPPAGVPAWPRRMTQPTGLLERCRILGLFAW